MTRFTGSLLVVLIAACAVFADTVTEVSGKQWDGTIVSVDDSSVLIRLDGGLELTIPRSRIDSMSYSNAASASMTTPTPATTISTFDRSGRVELTVWGTGYGITNGVFTAILLDAGADGGVLASLVGGSVGFATPWIWSKYRNVSDARATLMTFGGSWGMWQGIAWPFVLSENFDGDGHLLSGMIGGAAGLLGTGMLTANSNISSGDAELITSFPGWTSLYWMWISVVSGIDDGTFLLGSTLVAGDVGILAGAALAQHVDFSRGDVRLINLGGLLGALVGGSAIILADISEPKMAYTTVMLGSLIGSGFAWWALSPNSQTADALPTIEIAPTLVRSPEDYLRSLPAMGMRIRF
jgi:hypothetical protein